MSDHVPNLLQHPTSEYVAAAVASLDRGDNVVSTSAAAGLVPETVSTAHVAVEAVLQAVEHVASREQNSVDLQFSVGGAELAVRVERHADEVRATFRTDSADLRAKLSHEWESIALTSAAGGEAVRIAPPVFIGSDASAKDRSASDAFTQHREQPSQRGSEPGWSPPGARARSSAAAASSTSSVSPGSPVAAPTVRHLHTLA